MKHRFSFLLRPFSATMDIIFLDICFALAYRLKFGTTESLFDVPYVTLFWFINAAWLLILLLNKPYNFSRLTFTIQNLLVDLAKLIGLHIALVSVFWVFTKGGYSYSREQLLLTYVLFLCAGSLWRSVVLILLKVYRAMGYNTRRFVVVGYGPLSRSIQTFYQMYPEIGFKFYGYFDKMTSDNASALRGDYSYLKDYIVRNEIDCVYCCLPYIDTEQLRDIMNFSEEAKYQVKLIVDFKGFLTKGVTVEYHDVQPVISMSTHYLDDLRVNLFKRAFDLVFSASVLSLGAPLFVVIALITKLSSKGPVFYSQERIGKWGKPFRIYKFRSMYPDAEQGGPALSAGDKDHRITPWGQFMRKTRLDEIPQFYNVLRGDMSVVGPRPERQYFINQIIEKSPEYKYLLMVKPGITSIGQIKFGYAENVEEMVQRLWYDLEYLQNVSFSTDVWLIFQTVRVMMQGRGK
ncbi:MAG: exopolysaccharide biosynthesis polyprenyl glycosylphosphotransferase [Larkinella arboricola]